MKFRPQISLALALATALVCLVASGCGERTIRLVVHSEPPGARLYWNTQPVGRTPCLVLLPDDAADFPEVHVFEARQSGYEPAYCFLTDRPKTNWLGKARLTIRLTQLPPGLTDADVPAALPRGTYRRRNLPSEFRGFLACEVKLLRVSDGRVLGQACTFARQEHLDRCAAGLAEEIKAMVPRRRAGRLAVATVRNRRASRRGQRLAEQMTLSLRRELSFHSPFGLVKELDLSGLVREDRWDDPRLLRDGDVAAELQDVRYVVLAGLAESVDP